MITPVRISNSLQQPDASVGGKVMVTSAVSRYSSVCGFNLDGSLLLIHHRSYYALYDGNGTYVRDLPLEIAGAAANPVWSRENPNLAYFIRGNFVKSCNVSTGAIVLVKSLSEYSTVQALGESDISDDGQFLVLAGDNKDVFTLNLATLAKSPVAVLQNLESIHMTPKNNVLVKYATPGIGRCQGMELFSTNMAFIRQVLPYNTHADMMTEEGVELLIHANGNDPAPKIPQPSIVATRLSGTYIGGGIQRQIYLGDWSFVNNVSCPIGTDFFFVSTYADNVLGSIWRVWLDGKREELCKHGSKWFPAPHNNYTWQPKVNCSRDGTEAVFTSNMGLHPEIPNYCDVYLLNLAAEKPVPANPNLPQRFLWSNVRATIDRDGITILAA